MPISGQSLVTDSNKKSTEFAVRCAASKFFVLDYKPGRASVELSALEKFAIRWNSEAAAIDAAKTLRTLYGFFDFQAVPVEG